MNDVRAFATLFALVNKKLNYTVMFRLFLDLRDSFAHKFIFAYLYLPGVTTFSIQYVRMANE